MFGKKKKTTTAKAKTTKKVSAKPAKKTTSKSAKKTTNSTRVYHVVKRDDGKWEVKYAGGEKAIKLFDNQKDAVDYTKKMSDNQDGAMLIHSSRGKTKGRIR